MRANSLSEKLVYGSPGNFKKLMVTGRNQIMVANVQEALAK